MCLTRISLVALCASGWCECIRYHCWYSSYRLCWKKAIGTLVSLSGVIVALWLLSAAFYLTSFTSPDIGWAPNLEMLGMVSPAFPKLENRTLFPYPATCLGCLQADWVLCSIKWWGILRFCFFSFLIGYLSSSVSPIFVSMVFHKP